MSKSFNKRSGEAVAAQHRRAGKMKHRLTPRGGSQRNDFDDFHDMEDHQPEWYDMRDVG